MKNRVEVVIAGNRFTMTGEQDEEYMTKIAALVDNQVCKIRENGADMLQAALLTACDMADNYVQAVQGAENLRTQISSYLAENKNLSKELEEAQQEIHSLERTVSQNNEEMTEVNQFKNRISELESLIEANEADKIRINELEAKLNETETRIQTVSIEVETRDHQISELKQKLEEAEEQHNSDVAQAKCAEQEMREMQEKIAKGDKQQKRIEELEQKLASTESELNQLRDSLSRLLK